MQTIQDFDVRAMFLELGARPALIPMGQQYAFFLPVTTDPYAQGVMLIVECLQKGLNKLGCNLKVDGGLGEKTSACIEKVSGPKWRQKSWVQIMGDVLTAKSVRVHDPYAGLGDYVGVGEIPRGLVSTGAIVAAGALVYLLLSGGK